MLQRYVSSRWLLPVWAAAPLAAQAQTGSVGIGTTAPDVSAALDIVSSTKGALLPRVADATALATPATGLLVYQTGGTPGFYYNAGTPAAPSWQQIATAAGVAPTASNGLTKTGNDIALGGTLTQATSIDQGSQALTFTGTGNLGVGQASPNARLDVASSLRVSSASALGAALLSQPVSTGTSNGLIGQSFTVPVGTTIRAIEVFLSGGSGTFSVIKGTPSSGVVVSSQLVSYVANGTTVVVLATPVVATAPGVYSFVTGTGFGGPVFAAFANNDPYAGGIAYGFGPASGSDLKFNVRYDGQNDATLYAAPSGQVGIGTSAPTQALEVAGQVYSSTGGFRFPDGSVQTSAATTATGTSFIQNQTTPQAGANFNIGGSGTAGGTLGAPTVVADPTNANDGTFTGSSPLRGVVFGAPGTGEGIGSNRNGTVNGAGVDIYTNYTPRLSVTQNGNVGVGTSSPGARLDVAGTLRSVLSGGQFSTNNFGVSANTALLGTWTALPGNGPQMRFEGVGSSFIDIGENAAGDFVVESNDNTHLTVTNAGNVGIGTSSPAYKLDVAGSINASGQVRASGVVLTSDRRFKTNIRPLGSALSSVLALRGVRYEWNALGVQHGGTAGAGQVGLIAQELEKVYPELVSTDAQGYKAVNYAQLTPVLIEALKEQQAQIEVLKTQNAALKAETTATAEGFEARLRRLEASSAQAQR